jgi:hypothetical protein
VVLASTDCWRLRSSALNLAGAGGAPTTSVTPVNPVEGPPLPPCNKNTVYEESWERETGEIKGEKARRREGKWTL